ncbi:hypothetical protein Tco_1284362 [Tanacetum coccineum]
MADENVPAPAPIRSELLLHGCLTERKTMAFTASTSVPAIYIQQFWNTLTYVEKAGTYRFQLDEDWFTLDANLLREALEITPIDQTHPFVTPLLGDAIMDFVKELGYPHVSKTSRHDRPRYPVLQMLWGIITSTNVDFAELMWEEFVQAIQTFLTDKADLGSPTKKGRKGKPHSPERSTSLFHLAEEDLRLGNLKFVPKGKAYEVFGMPIPNELISNNIKNAPYYNAYLEMVTKHDQKVAAEKEGKKKSTSTKQPKPKLAIKKSSNPAPTPKPKVTKEKPSKASTAKPPKPKPAKEKSTKATPLQKAGRGKVVKVHTMKSSLQLVDEPDEEPAHSEPEPEPKHQGVAIQEPVTEAIRPLPVVEGKDAETMAESDKTNSGCETEILQIAKEPGEDVTNQVNLEEKTAKLDQDQTGSDPGESLESRPQPEQVHMDEDQDGPDPGISRVALAGPDPEPTHDKFMADLYPKVQESLKFLADEHVILEDPLSSTRTLSSMKNLEDEYAIRDQFINEKSTDDEPGKLNVEVEVVSMVTVPIYQASSSIPPLSTPVIDLSPLKPASSTTQTPIFTATTITTSLPPPPQ